MNRPFLVGRPTDPPKPSTPEVNSIAAEALAVARQCAQAVHDHHSETVMALGEIAGLLDALQLDLMRAMKGGNHGKRS